MARPKAFRKYPSGGELQGEMAARAEAASMNPFTDNSRLDDYRPRVKVDQVNHPPHYKLPGIEAIEITKHLNFCCGNVVKYVVRAGRKDASRHVEDLEKAAFYLAAEIERVKAEKGGK